MTLSTTKLNDSASSDLKQNGYIMLLNQLRLPILFLSSVLPGSAILARSMPTYFPDEVGHGICKGLQNRHQCARAAEDKVLKRLPKQIRREGPALFVKLRNLKEIKIENGSSTWTSVRGVICDRFYVIEFETYEGPGMYLLDMDTGRSYGLQPAIPLPSPNGKWIIVLHSYNQYDSSISVYDIDRSGLRQRWFFFPDSPPSNPGWIDDATVEIMMNGKRCRISITDTSFTLHECSTNSSN